MKIYDYNELNEKFFEVVTYDKLLDVDLIINGVKSLGDNFLIEQSAKFNDGNFKTANDFLVSDDEIENAYSQVSKEFLDHIKIAKNNVEDFAKRQLDCVNEFEFKINDSILGHKIIPISRVLAYAPGGNYPLPSSCIMSVIPAKVAGVNEVMVTSPRIKPETIVAAHIAGADKIYKLGGAQAISAFAYGTESILPVDKIVGPGNRFVNYAKKVVYGTVDIDFIAGPSEVLVVADKTANPKIIAADMLAQSEHDKDARAYLITNSYELAQQVEIEAKEYLSNLPTGKIASLSFEKAIAVIVQNVEQTVELINLRAPEHLEIMIKDENIILPYLKNYGSLFIGEHCAEVFGDYVSGTNHVLPTNRAARYTGGLSVFEFLKFTTYQKIGKKYANELSHTASFLAQTEGLFAHKLASDLRRDDV